MKKQTLFFIFIVLCCSIFAQRNWTLYTNTTHMRDLEFFEESIVIATWGGIEFFNLNENTFTTMTVLEGLNGNNISTLTRVDNELMIAVTNSGIDRYSDGKFHPISLNSALGLASLRNNVIYDYEDRIYIGSEAGFSIFEKNADFPFPFYIYTYNIENGMPFRSVNDITIDDMGYIYLATNIGFSKVHKDTLNELTSWQHFNFLGNEAVNSISSLNNILVLGNNRGVGYINVNDVGNQQNWRYLFEGMNVSEVELQIKNSDLYLYAIFGTWGDLGNAYRPIEYPNPEENQPPIEDPRRMAIVSINNNMESSHIEFINNDIIHKPVTNMLIHDNKIYLTTWGGGIYFTDIPAVITDWNKSSWRNFIPNSIHSNTITGIASEKDKIWIIDGIQARTGTSTAGTGVSFMNNTTGAWTHYTVSNSNIISNNMYAITIDSIGRKWFGAWWTDPPGWLGSYNGISVLNDSDPNNISFRTLWQGLYNATISSMLSVGNSVYVGSFRGGINIYDNNLNITHGFIPVDGLFDSSLPQKTNISAMHHIGDYFFIGFRTQGLSIWSSPEIPTETGNYWNRNHPLQTGMVYQIDSYEDGPIRQVWFASSTDVMWIEIVNKNITWYRATSAYKRERLQNNQWSDQQAYFIDEERIFGAESAVASAIAIDAEGRVWIGSLNSGLTMYDREKDTFTNFTTANSPLHTNDITSLHFQKSTGLLLIGTPGGLMTVQVNASEPTPGITRLEDFWIYPNPFRPEQGERVKIEIKDGTLPIGKNECRIFDVSGQLVVVLEPSTELNGFIWDGTNKERNKVSSGTYFYLIRTDLDDVERGRIVLIR